MGEKSPTDLDSGMSGWIKAYARKSLWRVASYYTYDDLVQDGFWCYADCAKRYPTARSRAHFMSLLKRTFSNHITDLSVKRSRLPEVPFAAFSEASSDEMMEAALGVEDEVGTLAVLLAEAPAELKDLLRILATDAGIEAMRAPYTKGEDGARETTNDRLCRMIGRDGRQIDLSALVHKYLTGDE